MKKRAVKVLLPLLFSFCCVFSGFLSVNAFAVPSFYNTVLPPDVTGIKAYFGSNSVRVENYSDNGIYYFNNTTAYSDDSVNYLFEASWNLDFQPDLYDYYLTTIFDGQGCTFVPNLMRVTTYTDTGSYNYNLTEVKFIDIAGKANQTVSGYHCIGKLPENFNGNFRSIYFSGSTGSFGVSHTVYVSVTQVNKDTSTEDAMAIIAAINNQTSSLGGKLDSIDSSVDQAADDIQQSIKDQFSGDPEDSFSVDDIITQHNEKMGVLSFGSDVMIQFLDIFKDPYRASPVINFPPFAITIEGVEYQVWDEIYFNFEVLEEWVPILVYLIRLVLPMFCWLQVLKYCISVFERNFMSR